MMKWVYALVLALFFLPLVNAQVVDECSSTDPDWIWCDDFEQDRLSNYFEYVDDEGDFVRQSNVGVGGSTAMRALFQAGEVSAGNLKLAFGRTPSSYMAPVDGGINDYREVYWRMYLRNEPSWVGGGGHKLSRATVFASESSWAQAMIAHVWSMDTDYLGIDPASGTDMSGNLQTTTYNDFDNLRWLGALPGTTPLFDSSRVGEWYCIEAHARLNDAGQSNGEFHLWIDDNLEASYTDLNWLGDYSEYGLNAVFFENYWNDGSPQAQERYFDNIVVSTERIGCGGSSGIDGDLDGDGDVDIDDIRIVAREIGRINGFDSRADRNGDGLINVFDIVLVAKYFGNEEQPPSDTTAPVRSNGAPSGSLASGISSVTINLSTDESANCAYSNSSGLSYSNMSLMSGTGGITHSQQVSVTDGNSYDYYVKCRDLGGNTNPGDFQISFSVNSTSPSSSFGLAPNEPVGMSLLGEHDWSNLLAPWDEYDRTSSWGDLQLISDASAPYSSPSVARMIYDEGVSGGGEPSMVQYLFDAEQDEVYTSFYVRFVNWSANPSGVNKVIYLMADLNGRTEWPVIANLGGSYDGPFRYTVRMQALEEGARNFEPNIASAPIEEGRWYLWEMLARMNTPGVADGEIHWWLDGEKVGEYNDVLYIGAGETGKFTGVEWTPIWGGIGGTTPNEMYMDFDHIYVSGKNDVSQELTPNEPAGYSRIVNRHFNSKASSDSDRGTGEFPNKTGGSEGWNGAEYDDSWVISSDLTAPERGEFNVFHGNFPAGFSGGSSNGFATTQAFTSSVHGNLEYKRMYVAFSFKHSENWHGHRSGVNKLLFLRGISDGAYTPDSILVARGSDDNPMRLGFDFQGTPDHTRGTVYANVPGHENTGVDDLTRGEWHNVEIELIMNDKGSANGIVRIWYEGILTHEYTDVVFTETDPPYNADYWSIVSVVPVWGGVDDVVPENQSVYFDYVFVSGAP